MPAIGSCSHTAALLIPAATQWGPSLATSNPITKTETGLNTPSPTAASQELHISQVRNNGSLIFFLKVLKELTLRQQHLLTFTENLPCARHWAKPFATVVS